MLGQQMISTNVSALQGDGDDKMRLTVKEWSCNECT